ncbi:MAG: Wzz/FepE/Etk N-terminal domain-containing protein [Gemmatimonadaceae bacterium]
MTQSLKGFETVTPLPGAHVVREAEPSPLYDVLTTLLRRRRLIMGCTMLAVIATGTVTLLQPRQYTSQASFIAEQRSQSGALSGLAAQFGIAVPVSDVGRSPSFYSDLVKSRAIMRPVVLASYAAPNAVGKSLVDALRIEGDSPAIKEERAIRQLQKDLVATVSQKTGVISLQMTSRDAQLSKGVLDTLLSEVNRFNLEQRQSQAASERRFTELRLREVQGELRQAEDRATAFLERNRDYRNSPMLINQYERLSRDVSTRQEVYTTLSQAYEQARIEEVRDTPVITVLEQPQLPAHSDSRSALLKLLLSLVLGAVIGAGIALAMDGLRHQRTLGPDRDDELSALGREALADLRRPWRLLRTPLERR